jgi:hypothetical protein
MIQFSALEKALKPTDREITALAEAEATPELAHRFEPICRGPAFAVAALGLIGLAAVPSMLWRLARCASSSIFRSGTA